MKLSNLNLQFLSWVVAIFLVFMGLSIFSDDNFAGMSFLALGIFFMPFVFDAFNLRFARNTRQRRVFKTGIFLTGFLAIAIFSGVKDSKLDRRLNKIRASYANLSDTSNLLHELNQLELQVNALPRKYISEFDTILQDIEAFRSYHADGNVYKSSRFDASRLSAEELDSFYSKSYLHLANNEVVNREILEELRASIPVKEDFQKEVDYYNFRYKHSIQKNDKVSAIEYFEKILKSDKGFDFNNEDLIFALDHLHSIDNGQVVLYNYIRRYKSDQFTILVKLGEILAKAEEHRKADEIVRKSLKIEPDNPKAVRLAGHIANSRNHKKTAIKHFEHLNELRQLDRESCEILRQLTKYVAAWNYYSKCCDGSRSESTGRGACSHHGGVCKSMKEPIYRYKYSYCK